LRKQLIQLFPDAQAKILTTLAQVLTALEKIGGGQSNCIITA